MSLADKLGLVGIMADELNVRTVVVDVASTDRGVLCLVVEVHGRGTHWTLDGVRVTKSTPALDEVVPAILDGLFEIG